MGRIYSICIFVLFLHTFSYSTLSMGFEDKIVVKSKEFLLEADNVFFKKNYSDAFEQYKSPLSVNEFEQVEILKKLTLGQAAIDDIDKALDKIERGLSAPYKTSVFQEKGLDNMKNSPEFTGLEEKYLPKFSIWTFFYLYVSLIGFYIAAIIHFNKRIDFIAKILISCFIFIHSFFILHIWLSLTNYQYQFPHSHLMSTSFSFLYGPLLYLYFKRITQQYRLSKRDFLHLIPTLLFLIYLIPIYLLTAEEKLSLMLNRAATKGTDMSDSTFVMLVVSTKLVSLIVYGYFIRKTYLKSKSNIEIKKTNRSWQRNIYQLHLLYIISYAVYGLLITNDIYSGFFYHIPVVSMALMVIYLGYSANVQPSVFSGVYSLNSGLFFKYKKSGLTESLSKELKENLIYLFNHDKIYKENDINLEIVANRLNTTRHNASQVINEHFKMNFHELVNKYRISEAKSILNMDDQHNLNIIDIAYEVGYNNKVTFNKAFKKETNLTPSEYQKVSLKVRA